MGIGGHQQHLRGEERRDGSGLVHGSIEPDMDTGAFAFQGLCGLEIEQIDIGVGLQALVVGAQVFIVAGAGHNEELAGGVGVAAHLREQAREIEESLVLITGRELSGAQSVLDGGAFHTLIDKVVVGHVAQCPRVIEDRHHRRLIDFIIRSPLVDDVALLGAGGEYQ